MTSITDLARAATVMARPATDTGGLNTGSSCRGHPFFLRPDGAEAADSASITRRRAPLARVARALRNARGIRATSARFARSHVDLLTQIPLLTAVGLVQATNMLHWPTDLFDEGTYVGNAWAVGDRGVLAFYTYTYGHPPLGWLLISLWTSVGRLFGHTVYSLDGARELMCAVNIIGFSLLYTLARRLQFSRVFAAGAVILFALCPLSLYFHRGVLLDNFATVWAIAAFVLVLSPRRRLWSFAGGGACFAASVLSKETTLVILPALLVAAFLQADPRTRRYCLAILAAGFVLTALFYPLYATLKGELLPGPGHVSLVGSDLDMVATRQGTGNPFDPHSVAHGTVTFWLGLDPWLVGVALLLSPLALICRNYRAIALAYLIQVGMVLRPGYLPAMYVIAMLPFAALIVAGSAQVIWRFAVDDHARRLRATQHARWRAVGRGIAAASMRIAVPASALVLAALAAVSVIYVAPRWEQADHAAMTIPQDAPVRGAEQWLLRNVGREQRIIVTDDFWIFLIEHGFDSRPVKGGFNSPTIVSYWPLDKDPAVRKFLPSGWREFDYIVSTPAMRDTLNNTPSTAQALEHSHVVASFGTGNDQRIDIRKIDASPAPP